LESLMAAALAWGGLAASSLVLGVILAFVRRWPSTMIGLILAFGAGALISAVSFELAEEGIHVGSPRAVGVGLAAGALTYYLADGLIARRTQTGAGKAGRTSGANSGVGLALGSFLDGVPEQLVLGVGLAGGQSISIALLVAIFVSNLPEGIGSATDMSAAGTSRAKIIRLFVAVGLVCTLATGIGYTIADSISGEFRGIVNGFAAGALLVMLIDSMIPEASRKAGRPAGLVTVVGFAVATALSQA
jgi:zinc transporter, ZIP family